MDNGHVYGDKFDSALEDFRARFEELLGNANGWALRFFECCPFSDLGA